MTLDRRPHADDQLRAGFAALSRDAAFTPACPPADRLWAGARGELASADVEAIAVHMADCGACAEAWRVARDFGGSVALPAPARVFPWWLAAAAVLVIAAGSVLYYSRDARSTTDPTQTAALVVDSVPPFAVAVDKAPIRVSSRYALTWRGPNDGRQFLAALNQALAPYVRGEYAAAATELAQLAAAYPDTEEPQFYLGVSRLLAGDAAGAILPLERAYALGEPSQRDDSQWYLAAAYERANRPDEARAQAQAVCDAKGSRSAAACGAVTVIGRRQ
jgi:hypothetical protein